MATNPKTGSEEFGELLRLSRERLGMSRRDLVDATGLSYPYISQLETGYRQPSPAAIQKLADALQLSLDELFSAMAKGRRDELSVRVEPEPPSRWVHNASFAGGGAGAAPAERSGQYVRRRARARSPRPATGELRSAERPEPAREDVVEHDLQAPAPQEAMPPAAPGMMPPAPTGMMPPAAPGVWAQPELDVEAVVDQVVDLVSALPASIRLYTLARLQTEIVQGAIDDGIRERLES